MRFYYLYTFGCQMNEYDSERIAHILEQHSFLPAATSEEADLVILNTCSVREKPEHKVESYLGKLHSIRKRRGKSFRIGVMGCVAQQEGDKFLKRFPHVSFVLGTDRLEELSQMLHDTDQSKKTVNTAWAREETFSILPFERKNPISAHLSITKGCINFCSYCIVPYVRGVEKSRHPREIMEEVRQLAAAGIKEITLLGQNVNSYGRTLPVKTSFPALLREVAEVEGILRLRFVTSHPKDFSKEMAEVIANYPNICPYIHLPVQSGSDKILKLMNRGYTWSEYYDNIQMAKTIIPNVRFSSDFIVGFPGEEDDDFQRSVEAVNTVEYETIYVFQYSPRPGTAAETLPDSVPPEVKNARLEKLIRLQESITAGRYHAMIGKKAQVLVEGASKKDPGVYTGRTVYNRVLNFVSGRDISPGTLVDVTITEVKRNSLFGKI